VAIIVGCTFYTCSNVREYIFHIAMMMQLRTFLIAVILKQALPFTEQLSHLDIPVGGVAQTSLGTVHKNERPLVQLTTS